MKRFFLVFLLILPLTLFLAQSNQAQSFDAFFTSKACRLDFQLCGNQKQTSADLVKILEEPFWGGRKAHLTESLNLGEYRVQVNDSSSGQLLYTDGFSSLFNEWQSSEEGAILNKCYEQSIRIPFPKKCINVQLQKRTGFDSWENLLTFSVNPADQLIRKIPASKYLVKEILKNTDPAHAVDIAVIAEGYRKGQEKLFLQDAGKLAKILFTHEPFNTYRKRINVYAIASVSQDSGVSSPHTNHWKNTILKSHYHTFYEPRYLTTPEIFRMRDLASPVPYDAIFVLVNTPCYGGGGFFNSYTMASAHSKRALEQVIVHEFGHGLAGLGDEYFYDKDALNNLYDISREPWEPNITTLVQFDTKWKGMLAPGSIIPTPVSDSIKTTVGVFEGGGYRSKGIYRPAYDCRMRTNKATGFCPVCSKALEKVIIHLTED